MRRQSETLESLQSRDPTSEEIFDSGTFEWSYYRVSPRLELNQAQINPIYFSTVSVQNLRARKFVQHIH